MLYKKELGSIEKEELSTRHSQLLSEADKRELGDLYAKHQGRVLAYIASLGIKRSAAEDLTQNVFLQMCCDYVSERQIMNLQGYLFGVARYLVFEYRRAADRLPVILFSKDLENAVTSFPATGPRVGRKSDEVVKSVSLEALHKIIADLPKKSREAFELRFIQNLPLPIAAERAGCSENTLCQRVCRAVKTVRAQLKLSSASHS
jgi:RNA polymerase sigma factor (sigma-70 family)